MSKVAVVLLNWNGFDDTKECLKSLSKQSFSDFLTILVDNNSAAKNKDALLSLYKKEYKNLHIIKNDKNLGFAGGVNTGIRYALKKDFDLIALLNNDAIADKNWLEELVKAQKREESGITTGLFLKRDGKTIDSTGDQYSVWGLPFPRSRDELTSKAENSGEVFSGSGGNSLYLASMFKEIGLFDEKFFAYYEDTDISFRAHLYGYKVFYTKKALSYHEQGSSTKKVPGFTVYQTFKNLPLLFFKNTPFKLLFKMAPRFWLAYFLMAGNAIKNKKAKYVIKGYFEHLFYFWTDSFWKRFRIQKNKKASTNEIEKILYKDIPPGQIKLRKFRDKFVRKS